MSNYCQKALLMCLLLQSVVEKQKIHLKNIREIKSRYDLVAHSVVLQKSTLYSFWQKFRESNSFTKEIAK